MKRSILAVLLLAVAANAADSPAKPKKVYKVTGLSATEALITCQNGADPTFKNVTGNVVVVSCGATVKAKWDGKRFVCPDSAPYVWADEGEALNGKSDYVYCGTEPLLN